MNPESSPFRPGQPVPVEFFVGRIDEIQRLRGMVRASCQGRFTIGFVSGERGIGKSSLVSFVRHLTEKEDGAAGCHVFLGGVDSLEAMARKVFDRILKENSEKPWFGKLADFFGKHIRQVGLFGITVELDLSKEDMQRIVRNFASSLRDLVSKLSGDRKGILLILDDINGLASSPAFANWIKSTVDEVSTSERPFPVCMLVVGIEERRQQLMQLQPSVARIFDLIDIKPWSDEEATQFYAQTFESASVRVEPHALENLVRFTGGLPVLAHEIGDSVWRTASSATLAPDGVWKGIFDAAEVVGRKFLEPQVLQAIRSQRYKSILRKMAKRPLEMRFRRTELIKLLSLEEQKVLDNFLQRMKKLGALQVDKEGGPGAYRFPNYLHALYFAIESKRAERETADE